MLPSASLYLQMSARAGPATAKTRPRRAAPGAARRRARGSRRGGTDGKEAAAAYGGSVGNHGADDKRGGPCGPPLPLYTGCDFYRLKYMSYSTGCVVMRKRVTSSILSAM